MFIYWYLTFIFSVSTNMASSGCINNSNSFCCIYGGYDVKKKKRQQNITNFFKKTCYAYFDMKLGKMETRREKCASRIVCHTSHMYWKMDSLNLPHFTYNCIFLKKIIWIFHLGIETYICEFLPQNKIFKYIFTENCSYK